jgi:hypothetical protein
LAYEFGSLAGAVRIDVRDYYPGPFFGELQTSRPADPLATAGDDGDLV